MSTAPLAEIQAALCARIVSSASNVFPATSNITSPPIQVALPLANYTPAAGTAYLEARPLLLVTPEQYGMAFDGDGDTIHRGIFQIDAVVPDNKGEAQGLRLAKLVADRFALGTMLTAGAYRVKILRPPAVASAIHDKSWIRYPVSVPWFVS